MDAKKFFAELKRRKVYRVAIAYAVVSWVLIQIATQTFPFFEIPNWAVQLEVGLLALDGPLLATNLAVIYAQAGETDLALQELTRLLALPAGPTAGMLRADPRFEALLL